ncbi:124_t:CDS:2, partial [Gigaspora margarita]
IKTILLNPKDTSLYNKNLRSWAKDKFILEKIVPGNYRVLVKATNNPVLIVEKFYDVLCHTHEIRSTSYQGINCAIAISEDNKWVPKAPSVARLSRTCQWNLGAKAQQIENKPQGNCTLVNELYTNNIFNEEKILDTIEISDANYEIDLNNDIIGIKIN